MRKRIEWVDVYKGILILLVVLAHSLQEVYLAHGKDFTVDWFRNIIYSFHMPAFMAMSGYLVYNINGYSNKFKVIVKRFKQLIIPLLIWTIAFSFAKGTNYIGLILYPNNGYWFLWTLFFIIVIFNVVDWISERLHIRQEIAIVCTTLILMIVQTIIPNPRFLAYEYIAYYFPFYMMGCYANKYKELLPKNLVLTILLFLLWFVLACYWTPNNTPPFLSGNSFIPSKILQLSYRMFVPIVFCIAMYLLVPYLKKTSNVIWKILVEIGQISLGIYLVHMVLKRYIVQLLMHVFPTLPISMYIFVEFAAVLIITIVLVKLLQKCDFTNRWLLGKF